MKRTKWKRNIEKATSNKVALNTKLLAMKRSLDEVDKLLELALPKKK